MKLEADVCLRIRVPFSYDTKHHDFEDEKGAVAHSKERVAIAKHAEKVAKDLTVSEGKIVIVLIEEVREV